jgi:hypothetical protein
MLDFGGLDDRIRNGRYRLSALDVHGLLRVAQRLERGKQMVAQILYLIFDGIPPWVRLLICRCTAPRSWINRLIGFG